MNRFTIYNIPRYQEKWNELPFCRICAERSDKLIETETALADNLLICSKCIEEMNKLLEEMGK